MTPRMRSTVDLQVLAATAVHLQGKGKGNTAAHHHSKDTAAADQVDTEARPQVKDRVVTVRLPRSRATAAKASTAANNSSKVATTAPLRASLGTVVNRPTPSRVGMEVRLPHLGTRCRMSS